MVDGQWFRGVVGGLVGCLWGGVWVGKSGLEKVGCDKKKLNHFFQKRI